MDYIGGITSQWLVENKSGLLIDDYMATNGY